MKKKHRYMAAVLLAGIFAAAGIWLKGFLSKSNTDVGQIERKEWGGGDYELQVKARFDSEELAEEALSLQIAERRYRDDELEVLSQSAYEELSRVMLNGNTDSEHITDDLLLPTALADYPFTLRWEISDDMLMDQGGHLLCDRLRTESYALTIGCRLIYEDQRFYREYPIVIVPPKLELSESVSLLLEKAVSETMEETEKEPSFHLPDRIGSIAVHWESVQSRDGIYALLLGLIGAVVIGIAVDYDEREKKRRREEALAALYAPFVEKLKLYLLSGLNMKNAFKAVTEHYEQCGDRTSEELLIPLQTLCNKFANHVREETVYEEWGNECRGPYKKLSFLLSVNLKKGNDRLLSMLQEEASRAQEARKELARKKGDEAGVKLLFPMMLMLLVVMMLIMLPAYLGVL